MALLPPHYPSDPLHCPEDMPHCIRQGSPENRTNAKCVHTHEEISYKELAHVVMETGTSKSAVRAGGLQTRRADGADEVQGSLLGNSRLLGEVLVVAVVLFRPPTD